jgi:hypothetical protein
MIFHDLQERNLSSAIAILDSTVYNIRLVLLPTINRPNDDLPDVSKNRMETSSYLVQADHRTLNA